VEPVRVDTTRIRPGHAVSTEAPAILGGLNPGSAVGVRPCIPTNELREGDTMFALGFLRGDRRRVLEIRFAPGPHGRACYVRVAEGWYRWDLIYVNVLQF
jgi:hypothetical protein